MSGIVGIVNKQAPVDGQLLRKLTDFLSFRGPDARSVWTRANAGLGHTLLCTTPELRQVQQPFSLDGEVWITADARIDGRRELVRKLDDTSCSEHAADAELILRSYRRWGTASLDHLIGDFSFAIWDAPQQQLFCARDQFGVKPFFYSELADGMLFSNTLDCIRIHPRVRDELNDVAVGDFLLFGQYQEAALTAFIAIRRLPAAHYLLWSSGKLRVLRYWTLPVPDEVRYRAPRQAEYVETFRSLLDAAVSDRLTTATASVMLSGGMDSSSVAAAAVGALRRQARPFDFRAHTCVFESLIPDDEQFFAEKIAAALEVPLQLLAADGRELFQDWDEPSKFPPEPSEDWDSRGLRFEEQRSIAEYSRIVLTGSGGDGFLRPSPRYVTDHLWPPRWLKLGRELSRHVMTRRRLPRLGIRSGLKRRLGRGWATPYPVWLNPEFESRCDVKARWRVFNTPPEPVHPRRPEAYEALNSPFWSFLFESMDPGVSGALIEYRHPLMDIRLVKFALALPVLPWCVEKGIMRESMKGVLPTEVLGRPKQPLRGDPTLEFLRRPQARWVDSFVPTDELAMYVRREWIPSATTEQDPVGVWLNLHPLAMDLWLRKRRSWDYKNRSGVQ